MKHVNFFQSPNVKKWGLAGCLLVVLGANLSFNPDSKVIARNDVLSGEFAFASTTGDAEAKPKNVDEIELKDQYKGLKVKVQYTESKDKARFIIEKSGETQAGICVTCVEKLGPETVSINELDRENIDLTRRAIMAAAVTQLDKIKPEEAKKADKKDKKEKPKKEDNSIAATFDLDKYRCEKPDEMEDSIEMADYKTCLSDNLKEMRDACKEAVQEKYDKEKDAASQDKKYSVKRDSGSCERLTKTYYNEEIRPIVRTMKKAQLSKALQTYESEYQNAYSYSIAAGSTPQTADEFAKAKARLSVSTSFGNAIAYDINTKDSWGRTLPGSLAVLHNQISTFTNDSQYVQNFRTEYTNPLMNVYRSLLGNPQGTAGGPAQSAQSIDITQLLQSAMNMDTGNLPTVGQPAQPGQPGRPAGSTGGIQIYPGRGPIGGGIPRTSMQGMPVQQQTTQAWPQQQQYQQPQQQQYLPQSGQPSLRQGGTLPGPRIGM